MNGNKYNKSQSDAYWASACQLYVQLYLTENDREVSVYIIGNYL